MKFSLLHVLLLCLLLPIDAAWFFTSLQRVSCINSHSFIHVLAVILLALPTGSKLMKFSLWTLLCADCFLTMLYLRPWYLLVLNQFVSYSVYLILTLFTQLFCCKYVFTLIYLFFVFVCVIHWIWKLKSVSYSEMSQCYTILSCIWIPLYIIIFDDAEFFFSS